MADTLGPLVGGQRRFGAEIIHGMPEDAAGGHLTFEQVRLFADRS